MRVTIVRHGDAGTFFHAPGQKDPDPGLSLLGRTTTMAMAKHLKSLGEEPTIVYASRMARARQTGKIFAQEFGLGTVVQEDGLGPTDHRGPSLTVVLKRLAAQDPKVKRAILVSHHDQIRASLADLNGLDTDEVDPIAKSEFRILNVNRKDGSWEEESRCLPSDVDPEIDNLY